jgi:signal transduction histidine kinase
MNGSRLITLLLAGLLLSTGLLAQSGKPSFNFDRSKDPAYVDSLVRITRTRLLLLNRLRPTPAVDTARMEYLHFLATVHYSAVAHRDTALQVANELIRLAEQKRNGAFLIRGLLLTERYYRAYRIDYSKALSLNYRLLTLLERTPQTGDRYRWRVYRNLGNISTALTEYAEAVTYLHKSLDWFAKDPRQDTLHLADLHQYLASAYEQQNQLDQAETHYLRSWKLLNQGRAFRSNKAYVSNEIGRLYNRRHQPAQALPYLNLSVAYWGQLQSPLPQADALADRAEALLALGRYPEAIQSAQEALAKNQSVYAPMLTAYGVLIRAYEQQQNWQAAFRYQRLFNEKKEEEQRAINQTESLRLKARFDRERLETAHRQEQLLQEQRYQTLAKQAEIERLNGINQTNELHRQAQTSALRHQLETQQLRTAAAQKQTRQQATIRQLQLEQLRQGLAAQKRFRNQLIGGLAVISLLGVLLLHYSLRLRRTNAALRTKNREIERALLRGQTMERKRVATELHDRVSSLLGATKMTFQTIDAATLPPRQKKLYENSLDLLNDAATQVRELSHNLIPEQLLQQDLGTALRALVKKLNRAGQTAFSLADEPVDTRGLTEEAKFNLYVICLELCTNVLHHARAQHARIRLVREGNWLTVQLQDDGIGLDPARTGGMGLPNIRERAEAIGARFQVVPGPQRGTEAQIRLPLQKTLLE